MERARRRRRCSSAPTSRPTRSTTTPSPPSSSTGWPSGPPTAGCGSPTRRSPGAATSTSTTTPGASSRPPATPRSAPASTASTSCPAARRWTRSRAIPAEKLFFLQLADAPHLVMDVLQWSRHYRCFPGQGGFDLAALRDARPRRGLRRAALARGLQRRLPPGRPGPHGRRRDALAPDPPGGARPAPRAAPAPRPRRTSTATPSSRSRSSPRRSARPSVCCTRSGARRAHSTGPSR